jgi:uncharacterized surface protein with fasciclin (FAS1) repeats
MNTSFKRFAWLFLLAIVFISCSEDQAQKPETSSPQPAGAGQSAVKDEHSKPNVVQVAVGSKDHSTLVAAVTAAELVDVLSNVGPFTVFAPVNSAFDALPAGTVESLLKPENKSKLSDILEYHVYVGVIRENMMRDGMILNQVNGKNITLTSEGETIKVNGAPILGAVEASNGIIYVIDQVLLPQ